MDAHYPTIDQPATAEYVLAVHRDTQRQLSQIGPENDNGASWSFQTTVEEWRESCELLGWRKLAQALNQFWEINCTDAEWRAVLEPAHEKRLGDVCELIARHARRAAVRPMRLLGCNCKPAGAFLTVRSLLCQAGASAREITPSTPLAPYTRRYCGVFLDSISRLAPGRLPPVRMRKPVYDAGLLGSLVGLVSLAVGGCAGLPVLMAAGAAVFVVAYALTWFAARWMFPASVGFGALRTFRDLARALSEGPVEPQATADGNRDAGF